MAEAHTYQSESVTFGSPTGQLVGIDKDFDLARFGAALLEITTAGRATVFHGNSLSDQEWERLIHPAGLDLFDIILTNPPFGSRIGIRDTDILRPF